MTAPTTTVAALDTATFDEEIATSVVPVLVEFWAEWCPPCKTLAPILEELATEFGDGLRVRKVNADEQPDLGARFDVMAVPTILLFVDGQLRRRLVGAHSKARLVEEMAQTGGVSLGR
jgi:thioredoxin 1